MRKINVHIPVQGEALTICREINARINTVSPSVIRFDGDSSMRVHITLVIGALPNEGDLPTVIKEVADIAAMAAPFVMKTTQRLYIEEARNRYVFWDLAATRDFTRLRAQVAKSIGHLLVRASEVIEETPHITLGHVESEHDRIRALLRAFEREIAVPVTAVEISDAGPKGTCIDKIASFELRVGRNDAH